MKFNELHTNIPYATGENLHSLRMDISPSVQIRMPGRHQHDTAIPGADFVVMVTSKILGWKFHQFTHDHIFEDIERKAAESPEQANELMNAYAAIVFGADPKEYEQMEHTWTNSLSSDDFLRAVQVLAVAEHRRYGQHEARGGGRYLPCRFASGIVEGLWTAKDCKAIQRRGRPGLDMLIAQHGKPILLKERVS